MKILRLSSVIFLIALFLFLTGCEEIVKEKEAEDPGTTDTLKSSTWMYSDNTGASWYVYSLEYMEFIKAINSFNPDPYSSIIAAGENGIIIKSDDGGGTWTVDSTSAGKETINAMSSTGVDLNGVAVGNRGTILRTQDDGNTWTVLTPPASEDFFSVAFDAFSGTGFATGSNGTLISSPDRGYTWNLIFSNPGSGIVYRNIAFATSFYASIIGDSGTVNRAFVLLTVDGGQTWGPAFVPPLDNVKLYGISFLDSLNGMAVGTGGTILKTTDGGWTWAQRYAFVTDNLYTVVYNSEVCMAAGNKTVIRSFDLGETWNVSRIDSANANLYSIFRLDAGNYFIGGD